MARWRCCADAQSGLGAGRGLDARIRRFHALIDEFQDTSPLQMACAARPAVGSMPARAAGQSGQRAPAVVVVGRSEAEHLPLPPRQSRACLGAVRRSGVVEALGG